MTSIIQSFAGVEDANFLMKVQGALLVYCDKGSEILFDAEKACMFVPCTIASEDILLVAQFDQGHALVERSDISTIPMSLTVLTWFPERFWSGVRNSAYWGDTAPIEEFDRRSVMVFIENVVSTTKHDIEKNKRAKTFDRNGPY